MGLADQLQQGLAGIGAYILCLLGLLLGPSGLLGGVFGPLLALINLALLFVGGIQLIMVNPACTLLESCHERQGPNVISSFVWFCVFAALASTALGPAQVAIQLNTAPYGMERCAKRKRCPFSGATADCASKTAWLTEPCQFFDGTDGPPGAGIIGGAFGSLPGIWNAYIWGYVRLQEEAGYKSVFLVRFEDLVTDPVGIIQRISVAMEMTIEDAAIKVMEGVAKDHGEAKNRSTEMRSLELKAACVRLNFSLAQKVGYPLQECQVFKDEAIAEAPIDEDHKRVEMEEKRSRFRSRYIRPPRTRGVLRTQPKTAGK